MDTNDEEMPDVSTKKFTIQQATIKFSTSKSIGLRSQQVAKQEEDLVIHKDVVKSRFAFIPELQLPARYFGPMLVVHRSANGSSCPGNRQYLSKLDKSELTGLQLGGMSTESTFESE